MLADDRLHPIATRLVDGDHTVRSDALRELLAADPTGERIVPRLVRDLEAGDRYMAARQLEKLAQGVVERSADRRLLDTIRTNAVPALLALAKDENPALRRVSIELIGWLGPAEADRLLPAILAGLSDPSDRVKEAACLAVQRWGAPAAPAVGLLIALLRTAVDEYAYAALGALGPAAALAVPMLRERARRGDPSGKDHAKQALRRITSAPPATPQEAAKADAFTLGGERVIETGVLSAELLALSADGARFAISADGQVFVRTVDAPVHLARLTHGALITHLVFCPDGSHVVTVAHDRRLVVFDVLSGAEVHASSGAAIHPGAVPRFSPDGRLLAYLVEGGARVWDRDSGQERTLPFHPPGDTLSFEDDGVLFVWGSTGSRRFHPADDRPVEEFPARDSRHDAMLFAGPGGRLLLVSQGARKGDVFVADAVRGEHLYTLSGPFERTKVFHVTADGALLFILSGKVIHAHRLADGAPACAFKAKIRGIRHAAVGGGDRWIGALDHGGRVTTWSIG